MLKFEANGQEILMVAPEGVFHYGDALDNEAANKIVNALNDSDGDNFDYVAEATLTLSNQFHGELVGKQHFAHALNDAIDALNRLDKIKKAMFYGRGEKLNYGHRDELNVEDMPMIIASSNAMTGEQAEHYIHGIIGMATEAGELLENLRDSLNGKPIDGTNIKEEVGDSKWYMAILAKVFSFAWGDDERTNIAKLRARFPNAFSEYDANNRNLVGERKILES